MLAKRLAGLCVTLLILSGLIFAVLDVLPGDPAAIMLGTSATPEKVATLRHDMALDRPAPVRYLEWLRGVATGDLGTSLSYGVPVSGLIAERSAVTLPLAILAMLLAIGIGLPLGTAAAASRGGPLDLAATLYAQIGIAVPSFWIGLLLILGVSLELGWLPADGFPGWGGGPWGGIKALVLPAVALGLPQSAVLTRVTRAAVIDVMNEWIVAGTAIAVHDVEIAVGTEANRSAIVIPEWLGETDQFLFGIGVNLRGIILLDLEARNDVDVLSFLRRIEDE